LAPNFSPPSPGKRENAPELVALAPAKKNVCQNKGIHNCLFF